MSSQEEKGAETSTLPPDAPASGASSMMDKDVAIKLVGEHAQDIDPEVEARVLGKIDWFLIPAMIVGMLSLPPCYSIPIAQVLMQRC